jgi:flagellar hook protein FlgE
MASSNALLTGLTGLQANSRRLEVIGNNISNVNTTAYKSSRMLFSPALSRNLSLGSGPSDASGGTNPTQVGLGVRVAGVQRNFNDGPIGATGVNTDIAIEGAGFFIVDRGGSQFYTRAGAFQLNAEGVLTTINGERMQGYGVDDDYEIVEGSLTDLSIPLGELTIAEATENVNLQGNLNAAAGGQATRGAVIEFDQPFTDTGGTPLTGASLLVGTLDDPNNPGTPLLPGGGEPVTLTLSNLMKGDRTLPESTLTIDATTTVNDLIEFVNDSLGIATIGANPDGEITGAQIDPSGVFRIVGNIGEANNIAVDEINMTFTDGAGTPVANPFTLSQAQEADGESVSTSMIVYDSLGTALDVQVTMVFESATTGSGTTWRYFVDSPDNLNLTDPDLAVASGTINFNENGALTTLAPPQVVLQRDGVGSEDPLTFNLNFASDGGSVTALADPDVLNGESELTARFQDGVALGTLSNFAIQEDGKILGGFTNGRTRTIGQIALATFSNPTGLVDAGGSLWVEGGNSGNATITTPGGFGTGRTLGGSLEGSNVDLGQDFINMILTSTGYNASSRVITRADELLQQLAALIR